MKTELSMVLAPPTAHETGAPQFRGAEEGLSRPPRTEGVAPLRPLFSGSGASRSGGVPSQQRGGTLIGLILGIIIGLGAALAVAVYVTKVPVPFLSKGPKPAEQDAAEAQKNKDWDPNSPLYGKNPARVPSLPVEPAPEAGQAQPLPDAVPMSPVEVAKPEAKSESKAQAKPESKPSSDPLGDLVKAKSAESSAAAAFNYFVQAGAFRSQADAEAQRAKLAMLGWESRVSEREQNGRTVFRVRIGPFGKRDDAEQLKLKLEGAGVDSALVRVQR